MTARAEWLLGMRRTAALALGIVPFGIATGVAATEAGMSALEAVAMSVIVFAGASQLAVIELTSSGASIVTLVVVAVVINLRLSLYSASLAEPFGHLPRLRRAALAYLVTDQAFALSTTRWSEPGEQPHRTAFYLGAGCTLWLSWQLGTALGATLGVAAPPSLGLDFAAPLAFIALAVPTLREGTDGAVAIVSVLAYLGLHAWVPPSAALLGAGAAGLGAGIWLDRRTTPS
ncbi:MAG: AzlC family ABC transporter permease [Deltaproteobacteria bacterium]|nr:AzlC family ABC transporter permease [Deltaproteobacteria bacterium]